MQRSNVKIDLETLLAGRSLYWLAKTSGIPYSTVHKIASSKTDGISFIVLEKLSDALECEPSDLIITNKLKHKDNTKRLKKS